MPQRVEAAARALGDMPVVRWGAWQVSGPNSEVTRWFVALPQPALIPAWT